MHHHLPYNHHLSICLYQTQNTNGQVHQREDAKSVPNRNIHVSILLLLSVLSMKNLKEFGNV
jgi:hypothetical protein